MIAPVGLSTLERLGVVRTRPLDAPPTLGREGCDGTCGGRCADCDSGCGCAGCSGARSLRMAFGKVSAVGMPGGPKVSPSVRLGAEGAHGWMGGSGRPSTFGFDPVGAQTISMAYADAGSRPRGSFANLIDSRTDRAEELDVDASGICGCDPPLKKGDACGSGVVLADCEWVLLSNGQCRCKSECQVESDGRCGCFTEFGRENPYYTNYWQHCNNQGAGEYEAGASAIGVDTGTGCAVYVTCTEGMASIPNTYGYCSQKGEAAPHYPIAIDVEPCPPSYTSNENSGRDWDWRGWGWSGPDEDRPWHNKDYFGQLDDCEQLEAEMADEERREEFLTDAWNACARIYGLRAANCEVIYQQLTKASEQLREKMEDFRKGRCHCKLARARHGSDPDFDRTYPECLLLS